MTHTEDVYRHANNSVLRKPGIDESFDARTVELVSCWTLIDGFLNSEDTVKLRLLHDVES